MKRQSNLFRLLFLFLAWLCISTVHAQEVSVTGTVTDAADGIPLPGVTVSVKGTTIGTITTPDGTFTLSVSKGQTIVFSFIGYKSQEVVIEGQNQINIALEEDVIGMDEVVVVGYGVQKKREITGSIAKVESEDIVNKVAPSFEAALQGQAAGVNITTGSGMAGSGSIVRIRGIASIGAGGDPLYVVDGIPITQDVFGLGGRTGGMNVNPLNNLNPNDIESVEVLKDAAATGIYGSRGANGVIIITTKRAKQGNLRFDFSTKMSVVNPTKKVDMTNSEEWLQLYQEAWFNDGNVGMPETLPGDITWAQAQNTDTDWWDEVTHVGFKQEYNLSTTFNYKKWGFYVGGSLSENESYIKGSKFDRYSGRMNVDYSTDKFKAQLSTSLSHSVNNLVENPWSGGIGAAMGYALPIHPIRNSDGTYFKGGGRSGNPVMVNDLKDMRNTQMRTINNLTLSYNPVDNLTLTATGAIDYMDFRHDSYEPQELQDSDHLGTAWVNEKWVMNYNYTLLASYQFKLPEAHSLTGIVGHEYQGSKMTGKDNTVTNVTSAMDKDPNLEGVNQDKKAIGAQEWRFESYFTRFNYMFKDRYIAQASMRIDGSSRFGSNNRYGYFPTVALGWIITEEDFLKGQDLLSFLKLKASYGITGNSNIGNYAWRGTWADPSTATDYNGNPILYPNVLENPDLKWETTESYDVGFEARFLNDRISTEFAYYVKNASDVLVDVQLPRHTGFSSQWQNVAKITNKGVEFSLKSRNLIGKLKWTTDFNIATLDNEVTDLGGLVGEIGGGTNDTRILEGYPVGVNTLVRFSRIDPNDGRPIYLDAKGNETKDYIFSPGNPEDMRAAAGKVIPDFTGGITNTFEYKGFDLSFLFTFSYGNEIYDSSAKRQLGPISDWNMRKDIYDRWRQPGDNATYPRLTLDGANWGEDGQSWFNTTLWLYDGSYMRLKNITLGYTLPSSLVNRWKIDRLRLFVSGTNLLTFTKYPGADPEITRDHDNAADRNMSPNVSYLTPPQEKVITFGLNLNF